jgi:hypothetical protein
MSRDARTGNVSEKERACGNISCRLQEKCARTFFSPATEIVTVSRSSPVHGVSDIVRALAATRDPAAMSE